MATFLILSFETGISGSKSAAVLVEPISANITATKGMRRFTLRGRPKVRIQWLYFTLVHNIEKIATTGLIHSLAGT